MIPRKFYEAEEGGGGISKPDIPIPDKNKIVAEANWRSTNGHGGVDDVTRDNFILAAEWGYSLASDKVVSQQKLIEIQKEYIKFLDNESSKYVQFSGIHGMKVPDEVFKRGQQFRDQISNLEIQLTIFNTQ